MSEHFDVVVVGARCAGAPLAAILARRGVRVVVVERAATLDHDPKPAQAVQTDVLNFLQGLGVIDRARAVCGPFMNHVNCRFEDCRFVAPYPLHPDDLGGCAFVRRRSLDPILVDKATEAGADIRMATKVTALIRDDGRVAGVRVLHNGSESELRAPLVAGADGRTSTVARLTGARKYNVRCTQRAYYWGYFENADPSAIPTFVVHRWADRFYWAGPANDGLYLAGISFDLAQLPTFRWDVVGSYMDHVRSCEPISALLANAHLIAKPACVLRFEGYFREASGPGWVLVGDAGHFKDPVAGRGVGDAFQQVASIAPEILAGLGTPGVSLDKAMASWGRRRDRTFSQLYWLAADLAAERPLPLVVPEMIQQLHADDNEGPLLDLLSHRRQPSEVLTPLRALRATGRLLSQRPSDRRAVLSEVSALGREEIRRRWVTHHPDFATQILRR
jgi:flavin-dependent dehydrogenase